MKFNVGDKVVISNPMAIRNGIGNDVKDTEATVYDVITEDRRCRSLGIDAWYRIRGGVKGGLQFTLWVVGDQISHRLTEGQQKIAKYYDI